MVDGDALEMRFGAIQRGFESPPLRCSFRRMDFGLGRVFVLIQLFFQDFGHCLQIFGGLRKWIGRTVGVAAMNQHGDRMIVFSMRQDVGT